MTDIKIGTRMTHYKNKPYQFLFYASHSETLEEVAVYECLYDNPTAKLWVRPRGMFEENVVTENGTEVPRFATVMGIDQKPELALGLSAAQTATAAARWNGRVWALTGNLSQGNEEKQMKAFEASIASLALWDETGEKIKIARANWLVARVCFEINKLDLANFYVQKCVENTEAAGLSAQDFDHAYALEAKARFANLSGLHNAAAIREQALVAGNAISDPEDRSIFMNDLKAGPWRV